jgi:hypothetical protein
MGTIRILTISHKEKPRKDMFKRYVKREGET